MGANRIRRFGDRKDGRRIHSLPPLNAMIPFIMKTRGGASNLFSDCVDIGEAERYLREKRLNGYPGMGLLHLFVSAYVRVSAQYPGINRFVSGQRVYARNNIEYVMIVKKKMRSDAEETSIKVIFNSSDTIYDVYNKLNTEINRVKAGYVTTNTDNAAKMFMRLPRLVLKLVVNLLIIFDYFGMLPKSLLDASPFHGSMIITDLGSIGMPAIYHHLYNFGNMPLFISFGAKRTVISPKHDGSLASRRYVDFKLVMDERICDGFYFSQAYKVFKSILRKPQVLDLPPEELVEDIE